MVAILRANPLVKYVSFNRPTRDFWTSRRQQWAASYAWQYGWDGTGVGVAVIDSGIAPKHDLTGPNGVKSRIVYSENFVAGQTDASDAYGHGTHVAGIIGSSGKRFYRDRFQAHL